MSLFGDFCLLLKYNMTQKRIFTEQHRRNISITLSEGVYLEPHHIKKWSAYPNLRFKTNNGITLCRSCHKLMMGKEAQFKLICLTKLLVKE